jgi:ATP-binding cassette subfamily F protein uup
MPAAIPTWSPSAVAGSPAPKRKLSFNETRALEALPGRIEKLRADLDALERKLADSDFPVREPAAFADAMRSYAELRDALGSAEDEWLGLEILREELERQ